MSEEPLFREYYEAILVAVIFTLFARTFVAQAFKIPTGSMEDNLLIGDHLFVNKFIYAPHFDTPLHSADAVPRRAARRRRGLQVPPGPRAGLHQARGGGGRRHHRGARQGAHGQRPAGGQPPRRPQGPADLPGLAAACRRRSRSRDNFGPYRCPSGPCSAWATTATTPSTRASGDRCRAPTSRGAPLIIYWSYEAEPNSHVVAGVLEPRHTARLGGAPLLHPDALAAHLLSRALTAAAGWRLAGLVVYNL